MARGLLAEGRAAEVARMLEPLVDAAAAPATDDAGGWLARALLAHVRVLRYGQSERALALLRPVAERGARDELPEAAHAEVALSLGWAHAWPDGTPGAPHALGLFDEAQRLFERGFDASGRCWALLGRALAYASIDEVALLRDALDHAGPLLRVLEDAPATLWYRDLSAAAGLLSGSYAGAVRHADVLHDLANRYDDPLAHGRAHAYRAALLYRLGWPPAAIVEEAVLAEHRLDQAGAPVGMAAHLALEAHVGALLRQGRPEEADRLVGRSAEEHEEARAARFVLRARIDGHCGRLKEARVAAEQALGIARLRRPLLAADAALILADLCRREGAAEEAQTWSERAHQFAVEVGRRPVQFRALPSQATADADAGDAESARSALSAKDPSGEHLGVGPLAANHLPARTRPEGNAEDAHTAAPLLVEGLVVAGEATQRLIERVGRLSVSRSPIHIAGERGTGKGLVARAVHAASGRAGGPFITLNCASVPRELFEDRLFGHEADAFPEAPGAQPGALRSAAGGTLFLDEVGDLPTEVQRRLLRFLRDGAVTPLGADYPIAADVRIVAATTRDLPALAADGLFDADLLDHLSMVALHVPPLRERREEIPVLVRHFLKALKPERTPTPTVTARALESLLRYGWPGNVRQLRNEMERALAYVSAEPAPCVDRPLLSAPIREAAHAAEATTSADVVLPLDRDLDAVLADTERALIERVLAEYGGQVSAAADRLGLTRQGLYKKIKRLGIDVAHFQHAAAPADRALSLN